MWNPGQRKAFFEKLKEKQGGGSSPQQATINGLAQMKAKSSMKPASLNPIQGDAMSLNKPITANPPQIKSMPDQFLKPIQSEDRQMKKKTKLPKLQSFFKAPGV